LKYNTNVDRMFSSHIHFLAYFLAELKSYAMSKYLECLSSYKGDRYWLKEGIKEYLGRGKSNKKEQRIINVIPAWIESQRITLAKRTL